MKVKKTRKKIQAKDTILFCADDGEIILLSFFKKAKELTTLLQCLKKDGWYQAKKERPVRALSHCMESQLLLNCLSNKDVPGGHMILISSFSHEFYKPNAMQKQILELFAP